MPIEQQGQVTLQSNQTYYLELVGTGEDNSLTGDLDIADLDGLTIQKDPNGLAGGAVLAISGDGTITFDDCILSNNNTQISFNLIQGMKVMYGGILYAGLRESLEITNSSLNDNEIYSEVTACFSIGGLVRIADTNSILDSSLFTGNRFELSSSDAYGLITYSSDDSLAKDFQIINSTITANITITTGGNSTGSVLDLRGSESDIKIEFSTITRNNAGFGDIAAFGGGIYYDITSSNASLTIKASFLSDNTS